MSVLKSILLYVRRDKACATVYIYIYMNHSFRERERERWIFYNFPDFIFKYDDIVQQNSASIQIAYMWKN